MASAAQFLPRPAVKRLLAEHEVDPKYAHRAKAWKKFTTMIEPLRWLENLIYGRKVRNTKLNGDPLFLIGFGRSGTTHLHNLFYQDKQWGVVSNYQAAAHPIALVGRGWLQNFFAKQMPSTRPMDNVPISSDSPQEEEMAMINCTDAAPLHFLSFPRTVPGLYDRYVSDLGKDKVDLERWQAGYLEVLKKATLLSDGKPLVLKTPPNTARVKVLLDMFPNAKFVNIVRNPYPVYQSMRNMYRKTLPGGCLQEFEWQDIDDWIVHAYQVQMQAYLDQRDLIPKGRLLEIRYEDLAARPMPILEEIYKSLELDGFEAARPHFEAFLESLGTYEKNRFEFPEDVVATVNEHWGFAFEAFGYDRIEPGQSVE